MLTALAVASAFALATVFLALTIARLVFATLAFTTALAALGNGLRRRTHSSHDELLSKGDLYSHFSSRTRFVIAGTFKVI